MERYLFRMEQRDDQGWTVLCPAFDITVDADDPEDAVRACRRLVEAAGRQRLLDGLPLPDGLQGIAEMPHGGQWLMCEFSLLDDYKQENARPVRRTVSLPEWLDKMIRCRGLDASRLFQDAAIEKLKEMDLERSGVRKVTDWRELEDACYPGVLDDYLRHSINDMLDSREKEED